MSYRVEDVGGLAVCTTGSDRDGIEKALRRLDDRLFLDPEVDVTGSYLFFTVKYHVGSEHPPVLVLEWRDENGPWELGYGIVDEVRKREGQGYGLVDRVLRKNEERRERIDAEKRTQLEDIVGEMAERMAPTRATVLHRGVHLRRSRERRRSRGEKC